MNTTTLTLLVDEISPKLIGKKFGRIFQLSRYELVIDLRLPESQYLFFDLSPASAAIFLIRRKLREIEKLSSLSSNFAQALKKHLSGASVLSVHQIPEERILEIGFDAVNEGGEQRELELLAQFTGRSTNLFLLDENGYIISAARESSIEGQSMGTTYAQPYREIQVKADTAKAMDLAVSAANGSPSEAVDAFRTALADEERFQRLARSSLNKVTSEIAKNEKLLARLQLDLQGHGDPEKWKRYGDLLLANVATAERFEDKVSLIDLFDPETPKIMIEVEKDHSITEAAEGYFRRYTKARNAAKEITSRIAVTEEKLKTLAAEKQNIESAILRRDEQTLLAVSPQNNKVAGKARSRKPETRSGTRRFISSDGFEILVGKKSTDNDELTFRIARSMDLWLHAADYPGSHVIIRNTNKKDIPNRTLVEAAKLAAFYSQGNSQPKAAVHYTYKKFVNKPKKAPPGLVRLASFKTVLVEPEFPPVSKIE